MNKFAFGLAVIIVAFWCVNAYAIVGIDDYTVLMLHFNGEDSSTNFVDSSFGSHIFTANGNSQIDTSQNKFGGASGLFDGNGDYLSSPDSDDWNFGSGDFTVDFWARFSTLKNRQYFFSQESDVYNRVTFYMDYIEPGLRYFGMYVVSADVNIINFTKDYTASEDVWTHVALVRDANNWNIFADGILLGTTDDDGVLPNIDANLMIGRDVGDTVGDVDGWMDELRISKGIARWTSNFTPPTSEYEVAQEPVIPEPATLSLLGLGLVGLVLRHLLG